MARWPSGQVAKQDIVGMPPRDLVLTLANPDPWVEKPLAGGSGWFRHGGQTSAKRTQALVGALQLADRGAQTATSTLLPKRCAPTRLTHSPTVVSSEAPIDARDTQSG